jgi:uncharacterized protein YndB with AHSA1/START domain
MASRVLVALRVPGPPEQVFAAFVHEIERWWRPNALFRFHPRGTGPIRFVDPGPEGRLVAPLTTGADFEIGRIRVWEPPSRLSFDWRQAGFRPHQTTEVHVTFEPVAGETRVTVEHHGWDAIPAEHVARHGFPEPVFLRRLGEWWETLLGSLRARLVP